MNPAQVCLRQTGGTHVGHVNGQPLDAQRFFGFPAGIA